MNVKIQHEKNLDEKKIPRCCDCHEPSFLYRDCVRNFAYFQSKSKMISNCFNWIG